MSQNVKKVNPYEKKKKRNLKITRKQWTVIIALLFLLPAILAFLPALSSFLLLLAVLWTFFYFSVAAWAAIWIMNKPFIRFAQQTLGMDTTKNNNKEDADNDY